MDYTLIAIIGVIVLSVVTSLRHHNRTTAGRPGHLYQRVITIGVLGLWLTIAGAIGWDVKHVRDVFDRTTWADGPIWWQIGLGLALLGVAILLARRIPPDATRSAHSR